MYRSTSSNLYRNPQHRKAEHFIDSYKTSQILLPTEGTYNKLIKLYNIDKMDGFIKLMI